MKANCEICGDEIEVQMCCSGRDCGCLGLPVDPPICDKIECWTEFKERWSRP